MPSSPQSGTVDPEEKTGPAERILRVARAQLFAGGYNALTMDVLAHELGMSKKTLYAHFSGKDEIVAAVIDAAGQAIRSQVETICSDPALSFTAKLRQVMDVVGMRWGSVTPTLLRELERFAPSLYRRLEDLKQRNIPLVIGGLLRLGIAEGMVRPDIDVDFAVQFWLQSLNGLLAPAMLDQLRLTPRAAFEQGLRLFFWALLSEAGRAEFLADSKGPAS